jgi:uncharacterized damage-inducible protein DinB
VDVHNVEALFDYGAKTRAALTEWLPSLSAADAAVVRTFTVQSSQIAMTPRKLIAHIALHEIRHWAQVAMSPPGNHDLFYSRALD